VPPLGKDEWDIKEDASKYVKNTLFVLRYASRDEAALNIK